MSDATAGTRYRRRPDVLWRRSLDAVVLLPAGVDDPITLSTTGPEVWDLLAEWRTLDDLAELLAARHRADAARVEADVAPLLDQLARVDALETAPDQAGGG